MCDLFHSNGLCDEGCVGCVGFTIQIDWEWGMWCPNIHGVLKIRLSSVVDDYIVFSKLDDIKTLTLLQYWNYWILDSHYWLDFWFLISWIFLNHMILLTDSMITTVVSSDWVWLQNRIRITKVISWLLYTLYIPWSLGVMYYVFYFSTHRNCLINPFMTNIPEKITNVQFCENVFVDTFGFRFSWGSTYIVV